MGQSAAYGKEFASRFGLADAPVIVTKTLREAEIAVTEVRFDAPRPALTGAIPRDDAFLVGLQPRDFPHHEMWEDGRQTPCATCERAKPCFMTGSATPS